MEKSGPRAGFYYAIASVPLMGAGVFGPDVLHLSAAAKDVAFFLCLFAALGCVLVGTVKEAKAEAAGSLAFGHKRRMIAIIGMFVSGVGFLGFSAAYFWPNPSKKPEQTENFHETPKVLLFSEKNKLVLYSMQGDDLYILGTMVGDGPPNFDSPRTLPAERNYYFFTDLLEARIKATTQVRYKELVRFEVYLKDKWGDKFTARFDLLIVKNGDRIDINTQQLGVTKGGW